VSTLNTKILTISNRDDRNKNSAYTYILGGMAEWSKAAVLKTVEGNTSVGSNPTPSANKIASQFYIKKFWKNFFGEMAELAEGARLLSE
jgi:hypothetical protein